VKTVPLAALALAASFVGVPPAHAETGGFAVVGASCGMVTTAPEPGPEGRYESGTLTAGPFVVARTDGRQATVVVTCSVQLGSDNPAAPDVFSRTGPSAFVAAVAYANPENANVFLCTEVTVYWPPELPYHGSYDADPVKPGAQCSQQRRGDSVVSFGIVPSDPMELWCVRVDDVPVLGSGSVCNPLEG
jgi:hypothetical protein